MDHPERLKAYGEILEELAECATDLHLAFVELRTWCRAVDDEFARLGEVRERLVMALMGVVR